MKEIYQNTEEKIEGPILRRGWNAIKCKKAMITGLRQLGANVEAADLSILFCP